MVKETLKITIILTIVFSFLACNPIENDTKSSSMLIVEKITGTDLENNEANFLQSDVLIEDPDTGAGSIRADSAIATLKAELLDPEPLLGSSVYNNIMVTHYVVSYTRSDGKNTEGVHVPHSFDGNLSALVEIGSSVDISFIIVKAVAKAEPPLVNLTGVHGEGVLTVTSKIDFYGHDLSNRNVKATGYLTIEFSNYVNE